MNARSLAVVLAAGKGTRMNSARPKIMHEVAGLAMVSHVLKAIDAAGVGAVAIVVAPDADWVDGVRGRASPFVQSEQRGTAHAVLAAREAFAPEHEAVVVLYGDIPLITAQSIDLVLSRVHGGADVALLAFETATPEGYGRLLLDANGHVAAVREEREASSDERAVTLCNSGIIAMRAGEPLQALEAIEADNEKGEYYLTDLIAIGRERNFNMVWELAPYEEVMGVNDRAQLAQAEAAFQGRMRLEAMKVATLHDPDTVYFSHDTVLGPDVTVEPNVVFAPGVSIGEGAIVRAFCHLTQATISPGAEIGPFARLRPGAQIGPGAKIGNFVEVKNAVFAAGAKANHLSYVGDASVGERANIGAGTITCNYDGTSKSRTEIGERAFIGSNSALVAPVAIGERAYIGSGSVITEDVPADALAIARERQVTKPDRSPHRPVPPDLTEPDNPHKSDGGER